MWHVHPGLEDRVTIILWRCETCHVKFGEETIVCSSECFQAIRIGEMQTCWGSF